MWKWKDKSRADKIYFSLTLFMRVTLLAAIAGSILEIIFWETGWMTLFVSSLAFLFTFLPHFIQQTYKIRLPGEIQIIIVVFIYASLFLGMAQEWYRRFWWWDSLMHAFSGIALGFAGFMILYALHKAGRLQAGPFLIVMFSFCFAVALGAVWEIFEFGIDSFLGDNMQRTRYSFEEMDHNENGPLYRLQCLGTGYTIENVPEDEVTRVAIYDTMWDLILDSIGALIAAVCGYIYLKKGEIFLFDRLVQKFEQVNPELFSPPSKGRQ